MEKATAIGPVKKAIYGIVRYADRITWAVLFFLMVMTMVDVSLRKIFNTAILGTVELTELSMVVIVFCSLAECQVHEGHIRVDLIANKLSKKTQAFLELITQSICCALFSLMTWALLKHAMAMKNSGEVTVDLGLPKYPFVYLAGIGSALLAAVLLCKAIEAFYEVRK